MGRSSKSHVQIVNALTPLDADELKSLIADHVRTQIAESWLGGGDPNDTPIIQAEANLATLKLYRFIQILVEHGE